jgi:protein-tyrosine-phosphatase
MTTSATKPYRILYICRHNAVRSQVAEALTRRIGGASVDVVSAGVEPAPVPEVVARLVHGLDGKAVSPNSKPLESVAAEEFDVIVTLCDKSHAALAEHPGDRRHVRWDFHHAEDDESLSHLKIELAERIRVFLEANHVI